MPLQESDTRIQTATSKVLRQYWGYDQFRGIQEDIILSILSGHDTLGLMPTGGGKSITFQVPALVLEGVCIVVTPLIALMKDQVQNLRKRSISAAAIYSGMSHSEVLRILENAIFGAVKILYVSPERLESEFFQTKLKHIPVSFITVDEAHCISQWGYDFRPSYLRIARIRNFFPDKPILALTATATAEVVEDIQDQLQFRDRCVFRMSFERKNLTYVVRETDDKQEELLHILTHVQGSAIVYVRNRQKTKDISELLIQNDITSTFYHAGLDDADKDRRQKAWTSDKIRVIVATNAFGMGIDKPDVRIVVHLDCPDSIEAYFQEAGRAGRDGNNSFAVLLYNRSDHQKLLKRIPDNYPEKDYIKEVYNKLCYFYEIATGSGYNAMFEFDINRFCAAYKLFPIHVESSLHLLTQCGYIDYQEDAETSDRLHFLLLRHQLDQLENNTANEDKVITAMLRSYGGLFADYQFISLGDIAIQTGLEKDQVYHILQGLDARHILHFIPQKRIPHIRFTQRREDADHLLFPKEVYEERKLQFEKRILALLSYTENKDRCRSRMLLEYFGEKDSERCGKCDCCRKINKETASASKEIMEKLSDGENHFIEEISALPYPSEIIEAALQQLEASEQLYQMDGQLSIRRPK